MSHARTAERLPPAAAALVDLDDTLIVYNGVSEQSWRAACAAVPGIQSNDGDRLRYELLRLRDELWSDEDRARRARQDPIDARLNIAEHALKAIGADPGLAVGLVADYSRRRDAAVHL